MSDKKPDPQHRIRPKPLEIVPSLVSDIGEAEETWSEATQAEWELFRRSETSSVISDDDNAAVRRLFGLYDERERLEQVVTAEGILTMGHAGNLVLNPARRVLLEVDRQIVQLEDRFGRNPKARIGLGIAIADAHKSLEALNAQFRDG